MPINLFYLTLLLSCCAYALLRGGAPERIGVLVVAANAVLSFAVVSAPPIRFQGVEIGVFIVDAIAFVAFAFLAVRADRFWPIWVSAFLGLGVLGHLAQWLGPDVIPWAYAAVLSIWSYPILGIIALGTWHHQRRLAHVGVDNSWSTSSSPWDPRPPVGPIS